MVKAAKLAKAPKAAKASKAAAIEDDQNTSIEATTAPAPVVAKAGKKSGKRAAEPVATAPAKSQPKKKVAKLAQNDDASSSASDDDDEDDIAVDGELQLSGYAS